MKVLKIILWILAILVVFLLLVVLFAPTQYHVEEEATYDAPKEVVYEQVVHFSNFEEWSPWAGIDPDMKIEIEGTEGEVGSRYSWSGNDEAGTGSQEIVDIIGDTVKIDLEFVEPFESVAETYYIIESVNESENQTRVVWGMHSTMPRPLNVFGWLMDFEQSIGADYKKGLDNLKGVLADLDWEEEKMEVADGEMSDTTETHMENDNY